MTSSVLCCFVVITALLASTCSSTADVQQDRKQFHVDAKYRVPAICELIALAGSETSDKVKIAKPEMEMSYDDSAKEKRKWGENTMSTWGKRAGAVSTSGPGLPNIDDVDVVIALCEYLRRRAAGDPTADRFRRGWGDNSMTSWGKRGWGDKDMQAWGKRQWGENSMSVWGKRWAGEQGDDKRKWGENTVG